MAASTVGATSVSFEISFYFGADMAVHPVLLSASLA